MVKDALARYSRQGFPRVMMVPLLLVLLLGVAACGGTDPTATPTPSPTPAAPAATATATPTLVPGEPTPTPRPAATATPTTAPEPSRDLAAYMTGKTVTLVIGTAPGGSYDTRARAMAQVFKKYTPGNPRFVVRSIVGGGGERAIVAVFSGPADGLTMFDGHQRFVLRPLVGESSPKGWDPLHPTIGDLTAQVDRSRVFLIHSDVATTWDEVVQSGKTITVGAVTRGYSGATGPIFVNAFGDAGERFKLIYGYDGSADMRLAWARHEIDAVGLGGCKDVSDIFPEIFEDGGVSLLFWWGPEEGLPRNDPTTAYDECVADGVLNMDTALHVYGLTPNADESAKNIFYVANNITKGYTLHPDTPADLIAMWREVAEKAANDPEYIRILTALGSDSGWAPHTVFEDTYRQAQEALAADPSKIDILKELIGA